MGDSPFCGGSVSKGGSDRANLTERPRRGDGDAHVARGAGAVVRRQRTDPWSDAAANPGTENDPWGPATSAWPPAARGATAASADAAAEEDSNYEAALKGLTGSGVRSAGYEEALEKLETDRRAERARRKAEAEAARQRETARAAAERREQAERDAAERRAATARDSARRQALERAARERRELSRRSYEESVRQFDRAMRSLQETRRQQQRAYQLQEERDRQRQLQRQRQQQMEQARRQRMEEQRRERERQTYRPVEQEQRRQVQCVPKRKFIYGVRYVETCTTNTLGECVCI